MPCTEMTMLITHRNMPPKPSFTYTKSSLINLMIARKTAGTFYLTEKAYANATGTKDRELFLF